MTDLNIVLTVISLFIGVLQGLIVFIIRGQGSKIEQMCRENREEHREFRENNKELFQRVSSLEAKTLMENK